VKASTRNLFALLVGTLLVLPSAAQTANQTVTIVVSDINVISVTSSTVSLTIDSATAGSNPDSDSDNSTSYSITTNGTAKKITAALGSAYASGISLGMNLTAPSGGSSAGLTTLTTSAQDLVTGIASVAEGTLTIAYTATATPSAASNGAGESQTVTLTITS
jgi:hypothetical protein